MATLRPPRAVDSVVDAIGNTPLVKIRHLTADLPEKVEIYAKLEYFNPGGSVKDRPARQIVLDALERGDIGEGRALIDSTSGNTGVAYAMLGSALGFDVALVMPSNVSQARKDIVEAYGAKIIYSDPLEGSDGAILLAKELVAKDGGKTYWYADQYSNPSNPKAHELTTAPEIVRDTAGRVTHFVAGLGTTGTCTGTGRALRRLVPGVQIVSVEPDQSFHGLEGLKHLESSIVPAIYDSSVPHRNIPMPTDEAWDFADRLAAEEGLPVGWSSGASFAGALRVARELEEGVIVCLFADHADRYIPPRKR